MGKSSGMNWTKHKRIREEDKLVTWRVLGSILHSNISLFLVIVKVAFQMFSEGVYFSFSFAYIVCILEYESI